MLSCFTTKVIFAANAIVNNDSLEQSLLAFFVLVSPPYIFRAGASEQ